MSMLSSLIQADERARDRLVGTSNDVLGSLKEAHTGQLAQEFLQRGDMTSEAMNRFVSEKGLDINTAMKVLGFVDSLRKMGPQWEDDPNMPGIGQKNIFTGARVQRAKPVKDTQVNIDYFLGGKKSSIRVPQSQYNDTVKKITQSGGRLDAPKKISAYRTTPQGIETRSILPSEFEGLGPGWTKGAMRNYDAPKKPAEIDAQILKLEEMNDKIMAGTPLDLSAFGKDASGYAALAAIDPITAAKFKGKHTKEGAKKLGGLINTMIQNLLPKASETMRGKYAKPSVGAPGSAASYLSPEGQAKLDAIRTGTDLPKNTPAPGLTYPVGGAVIEKTQPETSRVAGIKKLFAPRKAAGAADQESKYPRDDVQTLGKHKGFTIGFDRKNGEIVVQSGGEWVRPSSGLFDIIEDFATKHPKKFYAR